MKRLLLSLVLLFGLLPETQAEHIIGGDMTYECLNDGVYLITLTIYRDDSTPGAPFDSNFTFPGFLGLFDEDGLFVDSIAIGNPDQIDTLNSDLDPCIENPPVIAVQRGIYKIQIPLATTQKWFLKYKKWIKVIPRDAYQYLEFHFFDSNENEIR